MLKKLSNLDFARIEVLERSPVGLDDLRHHPNFTAEFMDFLARAVPAERHGHLVRAITLRAYRA